MTTDCSLNYEFNTWKLQAQNILRTCCVHNFVFVFVLTMRTIYVHNMFWACNFHVLNSQFNEQSVIILWVSWYKNKSFWQRFTCTTMGLILFIEPVVTSHSQKWGWSGFFANVGIKKEELFFIFPRTSSTNFLLLISSKKWTQLFFDFCPSL